MTDLADLYSEILQATKTDAQLSILCSRAAEYARLHLYARKISRCNSLGEIENLLDEFRKMLYEILRYCREREYVESMVIYEVDLSDEELTKLMTTR